MKYTVKSMSLSMYLHVLWELKKNLVYSITVLKKITLQDF